MSLLTSDNIFIKAYKYLYIGSRELLVKYVVFDTISDTIFSLILNLYINRVLSIIDRAKSPINIHNCKNGACPHSFFTKNHLNYCAPIATNAVLLTQKTGMFSYLNSFYNEVGKVVHFHGVTKITGIAVSPIVYGVKEGLYNILPEGKVLDVIGSYMIKIGQYIGINPYESIFAVDALALQNNAFIQFIAQKDIEERKSNQDYSKFMDFVNNIWIESFVDASEHAIEYYFIMRNLFEVNSHNYESFFQQIGFKYKILSIFPLLVGGYLLNYNTKNKEEYLGMKYKLNFADNYVEYNQIISIEEEEKSFEKNNVETEICLIDFPLFYEEVCNIGPI